MVGQERERKVERGQPKGKPLIHSIKPVIENGFKNIATISPFDDVMCRLHAIILFKHKFALCINVHILNLTHLKE